MPLTSPNKNQEKNNYISGCMGNKTMKGEFPRQSQRHAICQSKWKKSKTYSKGEIIWNDEELDGANYIIY